MTQYTKFLMLLICEDKISNDLTFIFIYIF